MRGATIGNAKAGGPDDVFQSTHPVRGATAKYHWTIEELAFQSTHPVRGATAGRGAALCAPPISIHAPRAGCDLAAAYDVVSDLVISIHAPRAGCDADPRPRGRAARISIHAPRAGCDGGRFKRSLILDISIHAPRAGCDYASPCRFPSSSHNFNPRTPCGVRRSSISSSPGSRTFQSTHPVRGATGCVTALHRSRLYFNPRTPCGVRHWRHGWQKQNDLISIHAPRAGCDDSPADAHLRGAGISIHAPRAGCDRRVRQKQQAHIQNFNPRTPCGVRRLRCR